jgi:hypothetical protein
MHPRKLTILHLRVRGHENGLHDIKRLTDPLELIIHRASHVLVSVFDHLHHELCSLPLAEAQSKSVPQPFDCWFALETRQARPEHQVSRTYQVFCVRSDCQECFDRQVDEKGVALRVSSPHQHHHFMVQFERVWLKFDTLRGH